MHKARTLYDMRRAGRARGASTYEMRRADATKRGYDRSWRKLRRQYLASNPMCADCERAGRTALAAELHHIAKVADRPDLRLDPDNVVGLCVPCHHRRTARGE